MSTAGTRGPVSSLDRPGELTVEKIDSLEGVEALRGDWDRLQDCCPTKHVLLDHRWVTAWLKWFGEGKEIHFLLLRRSGRLVGIAPLILTRGWEAFPARDSRLQIAEDYAHLRVPRWRRFVPIRRVSFPLNIPSQNGRMHWLLAEDSSELYQAVLRYWAERASQWDMLVLEGLPVDSAQPGRIREVAGRSSLRVLPHGKVTTLYFADLKGSMEAFLKTRTGHFRKNLKTDLRSNERAGRIEVDEHRGSGVEAGLDIMFDVERRTWKARRTPANPVFLPLDDRIRGFFRDAARAFTGTDDAQVLVMKLNGDPVGGIFSLSREKVVLGMLIYLDDALRGVVTSAHLWQAFFERSIERGMVRLDSNANTINAQKWANGSASFRRLYLFHSGTYSRILGGAKAGATWLSRSLRRIGKK